MVNQANIIDIPENNLKWCSVSLSEVMGTNNRLEASVFKIEAKIIWDIRRKSIKKKIHLLTIRF